MVSSLFEKQKRLAQAPQLTSQENPCGHPRDQAVVLLVGIDPDGKAWRDRLALRKGCSDLQPLPKKQNESWARIQRHMTPPVSDIRVSKSGTRGLGTWLQSGKLEPEFSLRNTCKIKLHA